MYFEDTSYQVYAYMLHTWEATGHFLSNEAVASAFKNAELVDVLNGVTAFQQQYFFELRERNPKYLETYYARAED